MNLDIGINFIKILDPLIVFFLITGVIQSFYDNKSFEIPTWTYGVQFVGVLFFKCLFYNEIAQYSFYIFFAVSVILVLIFMLFHEKLGLGDIMTISIIAFIGDLTLLFKTLVVSVNLSLLFFFFFYLKRCDIMTLRIPFVSVLILGFTVSLFF